MPYLFLTDGVQVPALNIDSGGLVDHLLEEAERAGAVRVDPGPVTRIADGGDGYVVVCDGGTVTARAVVAALGAGNPRVVDGHPVAWEKRQLFVLDLPVGEDRAALPHTIAAVGDGHAASSSSGSTGGLRVVVGHEDIVEDEDVAGPVDHFGELLDAGVAEHFPFLRSATVERILGPRTLHRGRRSRPGLAPLPRSS